jgi:hypothetical protein
MMMVAAGSGLDLMNVRSTDMNYPDLIKWIFEFTYEHWILTFLFILVLRRFSIFTINLSDKKGDTNVINNRKQV